MFHVEHYTAIYVSIIVYLQLGSNDSNQSGLRTEPRIAKSD
jgi:hypothetical protein